jgi:hypothetical protein
MGNTFSLRSGLPVRLKAWQDHQSLKSSRAVTWQITPGNTADTAGSALAASGKVDGYQ